MPSSAVKHLIFKYMEKRYEGFLASNGLYVLDTFSGEVKFISHEGIVEAKPELNNPIISSLTQTTVNSEKKILLLLNKKLFLLTLILLRDPSVIF